MVNLRKQVSECIQIKKSRKNNNLRDFYNAINYLFRVHFTPARPPDPTCFAVY